MKGGRNAPCPCGSGKKRKRCHGPGSLPSEHELHERLREIQAREFQRKRQQGLGRPIVSAASAGFRMVCVANRVLSGRWGTFHEFLRSYLLDALGVDWFRGELTRDAKSQHLIVRLGSLADSHIRASVTNQDGGLISIPTIGALDALLSLSYDLYAIEHYGLRLSEPKLYAQLLRRLKLPDQFAGARFEIRVAAQLLRAGFNVTWLDESRRGGTKCEYVGTYPQTGKSFSIECKVRQPRPGADWTAPHSTDG